MTDIVGISPATLLAYTLACMAIVAVPGPTVTVIIANSMRHGARAGLLNVAGTQAGLVMMLAVIAFGLEIITTSLAFVFDWLRLIGAVYLIWLGLRLLRSDGSLGQAERKRPGGSFFWQGLLVIWSNPKALLLFGAFIPQFVTAEGATIAQTVLLGGIFMVTAFLIDGFYAIAAGRAGTLLNTRNIRLTEIIGGTSLVGGGLWLGLSRNA